MPYFYGFDLSYIVYVLPALIFALWAQFYVKHTFNKYAAQGAGGMTGADAARFILESSGVHGVTIEAVAGNLTDHYDPRGNVIRLSEGVYSKSSVSALGVAAHEAGHAVQYAEGYFPIKLRSAIIPVTNIGSTLSFPLILIGILFSFPPLAMAGVILFGLVVVFQLVTLPVEFNASRRAVLALGSRQSGLDEKVVLGAKKVLRAAAMTYVAALAVAIANFLRLLSIAGRSRRR